MFLIWEKPQATKLQRHCLFGMNLTKRSSNRCELALGDFPKKFKRDVKILRAHPARLLGNRAKRTKQTGQVVPYVRRDFQRDEETHRSGPFRPVRRRFSTVVEKVQPYHIERKLRSVPANRLPVSWKAHASFLHPARMRQRDVYRANRFFFAGAAWPGNSGDAHA